MSNVNHRYSSESWTLDLSGKRSPLSRWTGQDLLRDETFRLSLLKATGGAAPVVWLSGDRPCLEDLHQTLEAYVQQGLGEPVLAAQSTFPADSQRSVSPDNSQFALEAQGLLRHSLSYRPEDSSSPRQMQLSMIQLADLLAVLDQWQTETLALPERQSRLRVLPGGKDSDFVVPTWGRIAASLVVAVGATGIGGYILSQSLTSQAPQVALESAPAEADASAEGPTFGEDTNSLFGQFPTASGPPTISQAQDSDTAFNNPLILPQEAQTPPGGIPSIGLPTPDLSNSGNLGQIPFPQPTAPQVDSSSTDNLPSPASSEEVTIASADVGIANSPGVDTTPTSQATGLGIGNAIPGTTAQAPPQPEPTLEDSPLLADQPEADRKPESLDEEESFAAAPPLIQQPKPVIASAPAEPAKIATENAGAEADAGDLLASAPATSPSRSGQPIISSEAARVGSAPPPPAAPPAPQVSVAKPIPGNNQSRAVQSYLQSNWKPPAAIQQPLQYRLSVSPEGKLASVEALSPTAQLYVTDAKLPPVGSTINGAADTVQSTMVVTLTPSGQVNVVVEKTAPAKP